MIKIRMLVAAVTLASADAPRAAVARFSTLRARKSVSAGVAVHP